MALDKNETVFCSVPLSHVPFLDLLGPVSRAGFEALSMTPSHVEELERQGLTAADARQRLADHGLRVAEFECIAHWLPGQAALFDRVAGYGAHLLAMTPDYVLPMAAAVGARSVAVVDMFRPALETDALAEAFAGICDKAADYGLKVNIEFLPMGSIANIAQTAEIVRRAGRPNGGITLDTLHFYRGGSTLADLRAVPAEMIGMVQLSDARAETTDDIETEMMTGRALPGEGRLDVRAVADVLAAKGITAPVGVEVFSPANTENPVETTARNWMGALKSMTGRA